MVFSSSVVFFIVFVFVWLVYLLCAVVAMVNTQSEVE
jgi:hypothetical protein